MELLGEGDGQNMKWNLIGIFLQLLPVSEPDSASHGDRIGINSKV